MMILDDSGPEEPAEVFHLDTWAASGASYSMCQIVLQERSHEGWTCMSQLLGHL